METKRNFKKMEYPFFTIIVPTYARPASLSTCLSALSQLSYLNDRFEVIVVDDGSPEQLDGVVDPFYSKLNLRLLTQQNSGPATARNMGAVHANGEFLAFTDDDCMPESNWLKSLASRFAEHQDYLIGGQTINALPKNPFSTASQELISYLYSYHNENHNSGKPSFFASNNFALPKKKFEELEGFDTEFPLAAGEDRDFCDRWSQHGYQTLYAPEAIVYHAHSLCTKSFWYQHFNYGKGACHFRRVYTRDNREPLSFYLNLLFYPFSKTKVSRALPIAALLTVSQVANATGFFWEKLKGRLYST